MMYSSLVRLALIRFVMVLLLGAGLAHSAQAASRAASVKPLGFVAGPVTGTDLRIAREIAEIGRGAGVPIEVRATMGSIDNLRRMGTRTENAGLGIVQSDVLGFLKRSQSPESQSIASKVRLVAPLYREEVHLLADRRIARVEDLNGKRVAIGTEGSGSMLTAMNVFSVLGVKPAKLYKVAPPEAATAVLSGQVDAALIVGGAPLKLFQNMNEMGKEPGSPEAQALAQVHFLPLDAQRLSEGYEAASLSKRDYPFLEGDVSTVAVQALLVAYDFTLKDEPYYHRRCAELGRLATALTRAQPKESAHPKWREALAGLTAAPGGASLWPRDQCLSPKLSLSPRPTAQRAMVPSMAAAPAPAADLSLKAPAVDAPTSRLQHDLISQLRP